MFVIYKLIGLVSHGLQYLFIIGVGVAIFGVISWWNVLYVALAAVAFIIAGMAVGMIATRGMSLNERNLWMKGLYS